eukprot:TRINITY_DN11884_c0_g1_i1.p1 TRINITY_DN11884_c0_g1~~TRINITY_DN11884_c0_g1_i1.p1  ORF type:complete len:226 (-),score=33.89 TRINITY_DN11884_c0_g1_i1:30-707(-)
MCITCIGSFFPSSAERYTSNLYDELVRKVAALPSPSVPRSLLFHVFSGNGANIYWRFLRNYCRTPDGEIGSKLSSNNRIKVSGVIMDSVPLNMSSELTGKALTTASLAWLRKGKGSEPQYDHSFLTPIFTKIVEIGSRLNPVMSQKHFYKEIQSKQPIEIPQLFIHSKEDLIVPHGDVEKYVDQQKKKGIKIFSECFDNSHHCSHLLSDPIRYAKIVKQFVGSLL